MEPATANCCEEGRIQIRWIERDFTYGPDETGWSIRIGNAHGDYELNVNFCPFCGKKLLPITEIQS